MERPKTTMRSHDSGRSFSTDHERKRWRHESVFPLHERRRHAHERTEVVQERATVTEGRGERIANTAAQFGVEGSGGRRGGFVASQDTEPVCSGFDDVHGQLDGALRELAGELERS
jgi:hypothetical protein